MSISRVCRESQTVSIMSWALASIGDCHFARGCMQVKRYDDQPYDDMRGSGLQRALAVVNDVAFNDFDLALKYYDRAHILYVKTLVLRMET